MLDEIAVTADTGATNGNISQAVQNAQNAARKSGLRNASVLIPPTTESKDNIKIDEIKLTKEDIKAIKHKILMENSTVYKKGELNKLLKGN